MVEERDAATRALASLTEAERRLLTRVLPGPDRSRDLRGRRDASGHREDPTPYRDDQGAARERGQGVRVNCLSVRERLTEQTFVSCPWPSGLSSIGTWSGAPPAGRKAAAELQRAAATLAYTVAPVEPPADLEERVVGAVQSAAGRRRPRRRGGAASQRPACSPRCWRSRVSAGSGDGGARRAR